MAPPLKGLAACMLLCVVVGMTYGDDGPAGLDRQHDGELAAPYQPRDAASQAVVEARTEAAHHRRCPDGTAPCACDSRHAHRSHARRAEQEAQLSNSGHHGKRYVDPPVHKHHCCCSAAPAGPCPGVTGGVTEVLGFDDVATASIAGVPNKYKNFTWSADARIYNGSAITTPCASGYRDGVVSPTNVLWASSASAVNMTAPAGVVFAVSSVYATCAHQNGATAIFTGFDANGVQTGQVNATVNIATPVLVDLTSLRCNMTRLTWVATCGVEDPNACLKNQCVQGRIHLALDDMTVTRFTAP